MAYTDGWSITFPQTYLNDTDWVILILRIQNTNVSGMTAIPPGTNNLMVKRFGDLVWEFDLDDPLIVPSTFELEIIDPGGAIASKLFDNADEDYISLRIEVALNFNGTVTFDGYSAEDSIVWDEDNAVLSFTAISVVEDLNKQMLFDLENSTHFNPHSYTLGGAGSTWKRIKDFILDIWQEIAPTASLNAFHDWEIYNDETAGYKNLFDNYHRINQNDFYYYPNRALLDLTNMGDILRMLCDVFHCYTGFLDRANVFFRQLYVYDSGHTQTLGKVLSFRKQFLTQQVDYIKLESHQSAIDEWNYTEGTLEQSGLKVKTMERTKMWHAFGDSYNSLGWEEGPALGTCLYCRHTDIDTTTRASLEMAAKSHHYFKNGIHRSRFDYFLVEGCNYVYSKHFAYGGRNYMPIKMRRKLMDNVTEIEALKV